MTERNDCKLEIQYANPEDLTPHRLKQHPPEQVTRIRKAIEEAGLFDQPIVVDENYKILKGVGRRLAAIEAGMELVPIVVREGLTETQKRAIRVADNKVAESPWDLEALTAELDALVEDDYDLGLVGFSNDDLAELEKTLSGIDNNREKLNAKDKVPRSATVKNRCQYGDIWKLDRHYIYVGSCFDREKVDRLLDFKHGDYFDIVWADPPYGMNCQKGSGQIGSSGRQCLPVAGDDSTETALKAIEMVRQRSGHFLKAFQIWWGANHYGGVPPSSCWLVWDKMNGENDFADGELAWTNSNGAVRIYQHLWNGAIRAGKAANETRVHPNQKPVELAKWAFLKYGEPMGDIFDPFLGSGTSILAAEDEAVEMAVLGCDLIPEYCSIAIERWEAMTGKVAERVED